MNIRYLLKDKVFAVSGLQAFLMTFFIPLTSAFLFNENAAGHFPGKWNLFILLVIIAINVFYISGSNPYVKTDSADYL